jgi:sugar-specific transcriptional regulator TrmB/AraC-like DNA-binding protein
MDERVFRHLGVTASEESVYTALLEHPGSTLSEISTPGGLSRRRAQTALRGLEQQGLVSRSPGHPPRYLPAPPTVAVEALIADRHQELQQARLAAARLEERARRLTDRHADGGELVEVVTGAEAVARRYNQLEQAAREEVLIFDRPPYYTTSQIDAVNETERSSLARGVVWRAVYSQDSLLLPGGPEHARRMIGLGEQARMFAQLPLKLEIVDRRVAVVPLDLRDPGRGGGTLIVRTSSLLDALHVLFEFIWDRAVPLRLNGGTDPVVAIADGAGRADADQLLAMLAAGLKDETIARQLGISLRTLERRMRDLFDGLDAQTRFQAGWQAARRQLSAPNAADTEP